jgi:hypothetical protein
MNQSGLLAQRFGIEAVLLFKNQGVLLVEYVSIL